MTKVLVADDHPITIHGIKQILLEEPDIRLVGEARNAEGVYRLLAEGHWDVLILDITMPETSGLEILNHVKNQYPQLPVLILSIHPEEQFGLRVLKMGAAGFLNKEAAPDEIVQAIRKVIGGGRYISPSLAEKIVYKLQKTAREMPHDLLSNREFQVFQLLANGKSVKQIAQELHLSDKTVATYRTRVLKKMNLKSNTELAIYALKNGLIY